MKQSALHLAEKLVGTPNNILRVASETDEVSARWAFTQWEMRRRARAKFALANQMLFDREGLEMATHEQVSGYHADQFPPGVMVADLTCGIGADLIALARRGPVVGFEIIPERAEMARFNLAAHELEGRVFCSDPFPLEGRVREGVENAPSDQQNNFLVSQDLEYAFADPARRGGGKRFTSPEEFSPNPVLIAEKMRTMRLGGIKLSPMLSDEFLESLGGRLEFISFGGECREALVWLGKDSGGGRFAVQIESGERVQSGNLPPNSETPGAFLFDCDPALVRAHATGAVCRQHNLTSLRDSNGYLTGETKEDSPWLRAYKVLWHGKGDRKATQAELNSHQAYVKEVKTRGVRTQADSIRVQYKPAGKRALTLVVWPVGKSLRHALVELA